MPPPPFRSSPLPPIGHQPVAKANDLPSMAFRGHLWPDRHQTVSVHLDSSTHVAVYHWQELLSRQTYICRNKIFLSRQKYACRDKIVVTTNTCLSRQQTCFVVTNTRLLRQTRVCHNKTFVASKMILAAALANDSSHWHTDACVRLWCVCWEITDRWLHGDTAAYPLENSVYYSVVRANLTIITAFFNRYLSLFHENIKCTKLLISFSRLVFWFVSTSTSLITNITVPCSFKTVYRTRPVAYGATNNSLMTDITVSCSFKTHYRTRQCNRYYGILFV